MKRLSQETKEIIYIVAFVMVATVLILVYVVYPLHVVKAAFGRADIETFDPDAKLPIDLSRWTHYGLSPDTLRVETDGTTPITVFRLKQQSEKPTRGTVLILHSEDQSSDSFVVFSRLIADKKYDVVVCDMRGMQSSGGQYRSDGRLEANDAEEILSTLFIKNEIVEPVIVVGFGIGGAAALIVGSEEPRIQHVYAVNPSLSTAELVERYRGINDNYWFPGYSAVMWWWWNMRSGYSLSSMSEDEFPTPQCPVTIFIMNNAESESAYLDYQSRASQPITIERAGDKDNIEYAIVLKLKNGER